MTLFSFLRPPYLLLEPLKNCWKSFAISLAKKLSLLNPRWFFSHNVDLAIHGDICQLLNIRESLEIGKYLGTPIKSTLSRLVTLFIWLKFFGKLVGWKSKLLLLASRVTFIQSILEAIPSYVMQCVFHPCLYL